MCWYLSIYVLYINECVLTLIIRFNKYSLSKLPNEYCDIKLNIIIYGCRIEESYDENEKKEKVEKIKNKKIYGIVGEIQLLLKCVLDSKLRDHELYEVERKSKFFDNCEKTMKKYDFKTRYLLSLNSINSGL